jgi:hypothetical protein
MKKILYILCLFAVVYSCFDEDSITGELPKNKYQLPDGNHPTEVYQRDFYQKYGTFILMDYDSIDYRWDITRVQTVKMYPQKDLDIQKKGIDYLKKVLLQVYSNNFIENNFPYKILFADSIINFESVAGKYMNVKKHVHCGINYVALGNITTNIDKISEDSINILRAEINGRVWGDYMYKYDHIVPLESFLEVSSDFYQKRLSYIDKSPNPDCKKYGFLETINNGYDEFLPTEQQDIYQFVKYMCTHTTDEMLELINNYDMLKLKYNLLNEYFMTNYKIDMQAVGNEN